MLPQLKIKISQLLLQYLNGKTKQVWQANPKNNAILLSADSI